MASPFLQLPRTAWVASNALAFAIRDKYPVSPGHTLVIPKREVATWFDATREEQLALLALVDEVKAELDRTQTPAPDGYNVGFNAGEAAGQTVMHLHVHVIPRYRGDMDDPRGGVRHVIPWLGNYLKPQPKRSLATGGDEDPFSAHLRPLFAAATQISIVAAFVQDSGLEVLRPHVLSALERGARIRLLTGDYLAITQVAALQRLLDWCNGESALREVNTQRGEFLARIVETGRQGVRARSFHPKSWRFESDDLAIAFVGSSNVSRSALESGVEWNLRLERHRDPRTWGEVVDAFERLWSHALPLTTEWIADYAERARRDMRPLPPGEAVAEPAPPAPEPHEIQKEALAELAAARLDGRTRALVVLATGLGKTWLAAFDVRAVAGELGGRWPRVLFLAHRVELLTQAAETFGRLFEQDRAKVRFGWCVESQSDLSGEVVFASVQKLSRPDVLLKLRSDAFDYVIVDEVHHADAKSYRRILDRLRPKFLLGLTATPDRADEGDVLGLFDDFTAFRADLGAGVQAGRLVPFAYFGIKDEVDYSPENIPWRSGRFDPARLEQAVETQRRMDQMWEAWKTHTGSRSLVFCCSIRHARFVRDWLAARGVRVEMVFSGEGSADRAEALQRLRDGELDAICSVDLFNEGVDVPTVDRVVMLRPTESPVVFIQQLGRGLRKAEGKERLTVIDFVGNHKVFLNRVRTLLSLAGSRTSLEAYLRQGKDPELPPGCELAIELEAVELLEKLLPRGKTEFERAYRELADARGTRPTAGEMFRLNFNPGALRSTHGSWFDFVRSEGHLSAEEERVLERGRAWLRELETTAMTKCFKMVVLEALIEANALATGLPLDELASRSHALLLRSPELLRDVEGVKVLGDAVGSQSKEWLAYWRRNPVKAWTGSDFFKLDGDSFKPVLPIATGDEETFAAMTRELVDYQLAKYRRRTVQDQNGDSFECKLITNGRDPILKLPSRTKRTDLPDGRLEARLTDGSTWQFRLMKMACNVAHPIGSDRNALPDLLRSWFGPNAGVRGTSQHVRFSRSSDGTWSVEPVGAQVIPLAERDRVIAFPTLKAAAGAATESAVEPPEAEAVLLPIRESGSDVFAVRATGDSMDGGRNPIRDGDWLVMRYARGLSIRALERKIALVQTSGAGDGAGLQVKRIVREGRGWVLRSDNQERPSFPATETTIPIATLLRVVRPEELAPQVGAVLEEQHLADAFHLSAPPKTGRIDGHLFVMLEPADALTAEGLVRLELPDRRPGETAFVLTREGASGWRYRGVSRFDSAKGRWRLGSAGAR